MSFSAEGGQCKFCIVPSLFPEAVNTQSSLDASIEGRFQLTE